MAKEKNASTVRFGALRVTLLKILVQNTEKEKDNSNESFFELEKPL